MWSGTRGGSFLLGLMVFVWALPPVVNGRSGSSCSATTGSSTRCCGRSASRPTGVGFLYDPQLALWSVALVNAWAVVPFNALIFRAALLSVDE